MKSKVLKIGSGIIGFLLIGIILFVTNSFVGNPISKALANKSVKQYVEENYNQLNLQVDKPIYNFKFGNYTSKVKSKDSGDTYFSIYCGLDGKVVMDNYKENVLSGWNTFLRMDEEFRKFVEPLIQSKLPYDFDMVIAGLDKPEEEPGMLSLDMEFDIYNLPLEAYITIYIYTEDMSWDKVAKTTLELEELIEKNNLNVGKYTVVLNPITAKSEKKGESLGIYDFPKELLKSENLPKVMEEHFNKWESDNAKY